jgi:hypothetical protein
MMQNTKFAPKRIVAPWFDVGFPVTFNFCSWRGAMEQVSYNGFGCGIPMEDASCLSKLNRSISARLGTPGASSVQSRR